MNWNIPLEEVFTVTLNRMVRVLGKIKDAFQIHHGQSFCLKPSWHTMYGDSLYTTPRKYEPVSLFHDCVTRPSEQQQAHGKRRASTFIASSPMMYQHLAFTISLKGRSEILLIHVPEDTSVSLGHTASIVLIVHQCLSKKFHLWKQRPYDTWATVDKKKKTTMVCYKDVFYTFAT